MFEVRLEGQEAVEKASIDDVWGYIDQAYAGREQLFWSVDGVAYDMATLSWRAVCETPKKFGEYLSIWE